MTTLKTILDEQEKLEAKATPGPWEAFDNCVMSDKADGERGKMVAEFFASNPIHGDNENDTYFVADLVNNAAQVREGVAKLVEELQMISQWAEEKESLSRGRLCYITQGMPAPH